ncbi:MAG: DUF1080 domain-containing protein [Bacteroidota bacterium]
MKRVWITTIIILGFLSCVFGQEKIKPELLEVWEPVPEAVTPGKKVANDAPSDAIVLFDGTNFDEWESEVEAKDVKWKLENGCMTVVDGAKGIQTKKKFGSIQLHIEWRSPAVVEGEGQGRGNSGIFFQKRYEVQVLDNFQNKTYPNGQAGSVYKQHIPLVNACRKPGEWQTYDIIFMEPEFNKDGIKVRSGYLTVFHNGVLVQNHVEIKGTTEYDMMPQNKAHGKGSIMLQDHGNPVSYRNIWVREL